MKEISRRDGLIYIARGLTGIGLGGLMIGQNCFSDAIDIGETIITGPDFEDLQETYGYDTSPPTLGNSRYAVELFDYKNNLDNVNNILFEADGRFTRFNCSWLNPLEIVVGFERYFKRVTLGIYNDRQLDVRGGAAVPFQLAGAGQLKYVIMSERSEEGYATPFPRPAPGEIVGGGGLQIDTGPGTERLFKFEAWPSEGGSAEVEIDYLITNA